VRIWTATRLVLVIALAAWGLPRVGGWWHAAESAFATSGAAQNESDEAAGVAQLLVTSGRSRSQVISAVEDIMACTRLSAAAAALGEAAASRRAMIERAGTMTTGQLPGGAELKAQLISGLTHSAAADDAYERWAEAAHRQGCGSKAMKGAERQRGDAESQKATAAKKRVVAIWNPIATDHGYPTVTYLQI
jgi:hypothetical protein